MYLLTFRAAKTHASPRAQKKKEENLIEMTRMEALGEKTADQRILRVFAFIRI